MALSSDGVASLVLLCLGVALLVVAIVCFAVYMANMARQQQALQRALVGMGVAPPLGAATEAFVDPDEVSFSRVATLPPFMNRVVVSEAGPSLDLLHGFLSPEEAQHLIRLVSGRFATSSVVDAASGQNIQDPNRTSNSVYLQRGEDEVVRRIERRAAMATGVPLAHFEQLQVVRYEPGQFYRAHFDYVDDKVPDLAVRGQRVVTVFVYLNDLPEDETGGGTKFHVLNKTVKPKLGTGALWYNMVRDPTTAVPQVDPTTLHSGEPVVKAVKYGLNIWGRTKPQDPSSSSSKSSSQ